MPRPRTIDDEQILEAARTAFLTEGMGTSTARIARAVGISHALLFQRFRTKEELFKAAFRPPEHLPWEGLLSQGPDANDLHGQLARVCAAIYQDLEVVIPRMALVRSSGIDFQDLRRPGQEPPPLRAHRLIADWLRKARAKKLIRRCRPDHVADILLGALQTRHFMRHVAQQKGPAPDGTLYVRTVVALVWSAIAPEEGT